jgi:hypothetical protein
LDLVATVVAARKARLAGIADDVGLDGDTVANLEVGYGGVNCDDVACGFVAENVVVLDNHGANAASVPEVNIGSIRDKSVTAIVEEANLRALVGLPADASTSDSDSDLAGLQSRTIFDSLGSGLSGIDPEITVGVGKDANIRLKLRLDVS